MVSYRGYKTHIRYDAETSYGSGSAGSIAANERQTALAKIAIIDQIIHQPFLHLQSRI